MNVSSTIDSIEQAPENAAELIRTFGSIQGFSKAYSDRVAARMGEAPQVAAQLASHWPILRKFGDDPAFAFRAKAIGERARGKWLEAARSFETSGSISKRPEDQALAIGAIDSYARAGKLDRAIALGTKLASKLGEQPLEQARARLNLGNALLWADDYARARTQYSLCIPVLSVHGNEIEAAAATLGLSTACLDDGLAREALDLATQVEGRFETLALDHYAHLARINQAHALLLLGHADRALNLLLSLEEDLRNSPPDEARVREFLGDSYLALQLPEQARDSYQSALQRDEINRMPLNVANCQLGLGFAMQSLGNKIGAANHFRAAAKTFRQVSNPVMEAWATAQLAQLMLEEGKRHKARAVADRCAAVLRSHRANHKEVAALLVCATADDQGAVPRLNRLLRRGYAVSEEWRFHRLLAERSGGRKKLFRYRAMAEAVIRDRLRLSTATARTEFIKGRERALSEFIEFLLSKGTPARLAEALDVIRRTRAATLANEIATSSSSHLPADVRKRLDELREELALLESADGLRRAEPSKAPLETRRAWIEAAHRFELSLSDSVGDQITAAVYAVGRERCYKIDRRECFTLPGAVDSWEERIDWLEYELSEPMSGRLGDPANCVRQAASLLQDAVVASGTAISPEGILWRLPWGASAALELSEEEAVLALCPTFGDGARRATLPERPRVLLWKGDSTGLPAVDREIESLQTTYPEACVCSTVEEARRSLEDSWDLIHVAAHAQVNSDVPLFSSFRFSDGVLFATDVLQSKGSCRFAVLGACESGKLSLRINNEPEGWARAFLARGSYAVVAAAWPVEDDAAFITLLEFHLKLKEGYELGRALTSAKLECKRVKPHPYYWSPFVIFGGSR